MPPPQRGAARDVPLVLQPPTFHPNPRSAAAPSNPAHHPCSCRALTRVFGRQYECNQLEEKYCKASYAAQLGCLWGPTADKSRPGSSCNSKEYLEWRWAPRPRPGGAQPGAAAAGGHRGRVMAAAARVSGCQQPRRVWLPPHACSSLPGHAAGTSPPTPTRLVHPSGCPAPRACPTAPQPAT